jgi:hypothetical protein
MGMRHIPASGTDEDIYSERIFVVGHLQMRLSNRLYTIIARYPGQVGRISQLCTGSGVAQRSLSKSSKGLLDTPMYSAYVAQMTEGQTGYIMPGISVTDIVK